MILRAVSLPIGISYVAVVAMVETFRANGMMIGARGDVESLLQDEGAAARHNLLYFPVMVVIQVSKH